MALDRIIAIDGVSGFVGSSLFNFKPKISILLNMIVMSLMTYFIVQYLNYVYFEIDGYTISDYIKFWQFWNIDIANTSLQFKSNAPFLLGLWSYPYELLKIIGFMLGGLIVYSQLDSQIFCEECSRYVLAKNSATSGKSLGFL